MLRVFESEKRIYIKSILGDILKSDLQGRISDNAVLIYIINGNANITVSGDVFALQQGTLAIITPNDFHCVRVTDNSEYLYLELVTDALISNFVCALSYTDTELISNAIDKIDSLPEGFYPICELVILNSKDREKVSKIADRDALLFSKATSIMKNSISEQISVSTLADTLGVSLSHLKRVFAKYTLVGAHEYYTYLKIAYAKKLLKQGKTVTETAKLSGFSNQAYFSAAFKRVTSLSPKEYAGDIKVKRTNTKKLDKPTKDLPSYLL